MALALLNGGNAMALTNSEAWKIYANYVEAWKAVSDGERARIAADVLSENVQYQTPLRDVGTGRPQVIEGMASFQKKFPGGHFDIGDVSAHHDVALVTWVLIQADGKEFARGHDQFRVDADGKIISVVTYAPPVQKP
jgi:hypothetical protein